MFGFFRLFRWLYMFGFFRLCSDFIFLYMDDDWIHVKMSPHTQMSTLQYLLQISLHICKLCFVFLQKWGKICFIDQLWYAPIINSPVGLLWDKFAVYLKYSWTTTIRKAFSENIFKVISLDQFSLHEPLQSSCIRFCIRTGDVLLGWCDVIFELWWEQAHCHPPLHCTTLGPSDSQQSAISCIAPLSWHYITGGSSENMISCGLNSIIILLFGELDLSVNCQSFNYVTYYSYNHT